MFCKQSLWTDRRFEARSGTLSIPSNLKLWDEVQLTIANTSNKQLLAIFNGHYLSTWSRLLVQGKISKIRCHMIWTSSIYKLAISSMNLSRISHHCNKFWWSMLALKSKVHPVVAIKSHMSILPTYLALWSVCLSLKSLLKSWRPCLTRLRLIVLRKGGVEISI